MDQIGDDVERRIAAAVRREREALGWSLGELAERSGVSKAMIGKVELCQASPTAGLLGRVCAGLGITMSTLMVRVEQGDVAVVVRSDQPEWTDPETGLVRRLLMGRRSGSDVELAEVSLPRRTVVEYPVPPRAGIAQHLVMRSGRVRFTYGVGAGVGVGAGSGAGGTAPQVHDLRAGDVLFARIDRPTRFETGADPASYLLVQDAGR